jgi:molybdopterin-guanine dinucleotide biosynthesis protein A
MSGADKPGLDVGGTAMLISVARAIAAAGCQRLIVVGPQRGGAVASGLAEVAERLPGALMVVREDPPGSGPVPALRCGLPEVTASSLLLLAADLPFLTGAELTGLRQLAAGAGDAAGAVLADMTGQPQWLVSCWQTAKLRAALDDYQGASLRGLLAPLRPAVLHVQVADGRPAPWLDCDTPADLAAARARLSTSAEGS